MRRVQLFLLCQYRMAKAVLGFKIIGQQGFKGNESRVGQSMCPITPFPDIPAILFLQILLKIFRIFKNTAFSRNGQIIQQ